MEVLVSLTVFSVGIMAVLTAVLSSLNLQKETALRYRAGLVLQQKLIEVASEQFTGAASYGQTADGVFNWSVTGNLWGEEERRDPRRPRRRNPDRLPPGQMFEVSVNVSWQTKKGERKVAATQLVRAAPVVKGQP
jgi:type II secretory pathway pseudopilin PulG